VTPFAWLKARFRGSRKDIGGRFAPGITLGIPGQPVSASWDVERAIREGYKQNNVVRDCIHIRSTALGRFKWYVESLQGEDWIKVENHPLELRLARPHVGIIGQNLFARTLQHLDLAGNGLWEKVGPTNELWPLQPARARPVPSAFGFIGEYEYIDATGTIRRIPAERVVHFQFPDPGNEYWGQATIQSSATMIDSYNACVAWNRSALSNNVLASMIFRTQQPLTGEDFELLQEQINRNYGQVAGNARRPIVVGSGMEAEMLNWKAQELDFATSLAFYRDQIAHGFGVPLPVLGELEKATHSNVQEVIKDFLITTMKPIAEMVRDTIQVQLLPDFGDAETERVCFDTSNFEVLAADMAAKWEQFKIAVTNGVPINQMLVLQDFDLDPVEGGDVGLVSNLLMPIMHAVDLANEELASQQAQTEATLHPPTDPNKQPAPKAA
jgi:HK97 family phage portal protein